jgi:hypothetical protein
MDKVFTSALWKELFRLSEVIDELFLPSTKRWAI